jgi:hypothetical protein
MAPAPAAAHAGDEGPERVEGASPEGPPRETASGHSGSRGDGSHLAFMLSHDRGSAKTEVTTSLLEAALASSTASEKELVATLQRCCLAGACVAHTPRAGEGRSPWVQAGRGGVCALPCVGGRTSLMLPHSLLPTTPPWCSLR